MEVILLKDVKGVGKKDQVVNVANGYAANYLIPSHLAVAKTEKSMEILDTQKEERKQKAEDFHKNALEIKDKLQNIVVEFTEKGNGERMFGSISLKQIEEALKEQYDIEIDKRKFIDKGNINNFGYSKLRIELDKDVIGIVTINIKGE
ncbi:MAG: 50S ribosomal protein L9 [Coprobacillus sp.]|nr:50S ribosomal protein L9 [Coprobacillus sp.]